ncbi:hypothetical protein ACWGKW_43945, partial [Streptomyces sp. NPDC054766]
GKTGTRAGTARNPHRGAEEAGTHPKLPADRLDADGNPRPLSQGGCQFGINMGTAIGVPLVAIEPRITAAVFGQDWPDALAGAARQITVPIEFDMQWDDEHIPRESCLALFDAFASKDKTLHANAGGHKELPRFEADSAVRFFVRHLGRARVDAPA